MVVPKINSGHGSDTRNVINRAIEVLNQLGVNVQDLVAEGQLTPAQYAQLIYFVNGNIKKGEVELDDLNEEVLKKFKDVSPEFNLLSIPRDGSVTPKKTDFIEMSSNLADDRNRIYGYTLSWETGELEESTTRFWVSDFIPVESNQYHYSNEIHRIIFYDENKNFVAIRNGNILFRTTENTHFIRYSTPDDAPQINKGENLLPYEPFYLRLSERIDTSISKFMSAENEEWVI